LIYSEVKRPHNWGRRPHNWGRKDAAISKNGSAIRAKKAAGDAQTKEIRQGDPCKKKTLPRRSRDDSRILRNIKFINNDLKNHRGIYHE
jgi:hypothetical protein